MGKPVVTQFVSVDGVFQDPGGVGEIDRGGWSFKAEHGEEFDKFKFDELMAADVQLLGRTTYEGFAKAWPSVEETDGEFAVKMNLGLSYRTAIVRARAGCVGAQSAKGQRCR